MILTVSTMFSRNLSSSGHYKESQLRFLEVRIN